MSARTLLLGLGNPLLSDDAIGLVLARRVYRALAERHELPPAGLEHEPPLGELDLPAPELTLPSGDVVGLVEAAVSGIAVLDVACGWDRLVLTDSIKTVGGKPGTVMRLGLEAFQDTVRTSSPHDLNLASALEFGARQGFDVPKEFVIYAVEAVDVLTFHEGLSPPVERALDGAVARILEEQFGVSG